MTVRVGINGFGRIGRNFFRAAKQRGADIDFVAVNDLGSLETMAHLLKYDSVLGTLPHDDQGRRRAASRSTATSCRCCPMRDPNELPWGDLGVDVVIESTGFFTSRDTAAPHLEAGAPLVIVSAPCDGADATFVYGVNHKDFDFAQHKVDLERELHHQLLRADGQGARRRVRRRAGPDDDDPRLHRRPAARRRPAQRPAPGPRRGDQHRARPRTGAARATALVLESMKGKLDGTSLRVPVPTGSITDFTAILQHDGDGRRDQRGVQEGRGERVR